MKNPGRIVITKSGKKGRTFNRDIAINGKTPVYLEVKEHEYTGKAILCDPESLNFIGFID